jgi:hypothetical protein
MVYYKIVKDSDNNICYGYTDDVEFVNFGKGFSGLKIYVLTLSEFLTEADGATINIHLNSEVSYGTVVGGKIILEI